MAIEQVKVRARIEGAGISAETPFIQSFSVHKARGQASTFNFSVKVPKIDLASIKGVVRIYAGSGGNSNLLITGIITKATLSPSWDDPRYVIVNASGTDMFKLLENKKYTRRQISTKACWCEITGVTRQHLKSQKFKYLSTNNLLMVTDGDVMTDNEVIKTTSINKLPESVGRNVQRGNKDNNVPIRVSIKSQ